MVKEYPIEVPEVVLAAKNLAVQLGLDLRSEGNSAGRSTGGPSACLDEVGSLLRTLAATVVNGHVGEVGTGAGVGTAWMTSRLSRNSSLTSVELDLGLANAAAELFQSYPNVMVVAGDWLEVMPEYGPFDLLFFDGGGRDALQPANWQTIANLVKSAGTMVIDDLTPEEYWPEEWRGKPDPKRELAFRSGLFTATEVRSRADSAILMLVRQQDVSKERQ